MGTGDLGESIFRQWVNQAGLEPHKGDNDNDGWDFIVSYPYEVDNNLKSLDLEDRPTRCFFQIKTTKTNKITEQIKLSNLRKFVFSPLPAFYLVIQVKNGEARDAYLYHVWEEIIKRSLKKLREIDDPKNAKLNEIKIQLPKGKAQKLDGLHGKELRKLLENNIKGGGSNYAERKNKLRNSVGYENGRAKINFEAKLPEKYKGKPGEFFVDLTLGLVDKAKLKKYSVFDIRFGEPVEIESNKGGNFTVNPKPEEKLIISLSTLDNRIYTEFESELYLPSGIAISKEKLKILYRSPYLNIIAMPGENQIKINCDLPDFNSECHLSDFRAFSEVVSFMNRVGEEQIKIEFKHKTKPTIDLSLGSPLFLGHKIATFAEVVQSALLLKERFKIREDILFTPSNLYVQSDKLIFLGNLLRNENVSFDLEMDGKPIIGQYPKIIIAYPINVFLGYSTYCIQIGIHGNPKVVNNQTDGELIKYELTTSNVKVENHMKLSNDKSNTIDAHSTLYSNTKQKYEDEDTIVVYMSQKDNQKTRIDLKTD